MHYLENNKSVTQNIVIALGDADLQNRIKFNTVHGLFHMKYGDNKHWEQSKKALHLIPKSLNKGKQQLGDTPFLYNIVYKDKRTHYVYVIGIPSNLGDETVLITCL